MRKREDYKRRSGAIDCGHPYSGGCRIAHSPYALIFHSTRALHSLARSRNLPCPRPQQKVRVVLSTTAPRIQINQEDER